MTNPLYANDAVATFPPSYYAANATPAPERPSLTGMRKTDIAIVGAGFTGLWAALELARRGFDVTVIEAHRAGWGASGRNGGQVGSDFNQGQRWLEKRVGFDNAKALWAMSQEAAFMVRDFCAAHAPEAGFKPGIVHGDSSGDLTEFQEDVAHLDKHYPTHGVSVLSTGEVRAIVRTENYRSGTLDMNAGHVHPLRYVLALAREAEKAGATIFERTEALRIDTGPRAVIHTPSGQLTADHVILAGNGYIRGLNTPSDARTLPVNSFIGATEPLGDEALDVLARDVAVFDSSWVVNYFRLSDDKRLLFGGRANFSRKFPKNMDQALHKRMTDMFPQLAAKRFDYTWGGTLGITRSRLPYANRVAPNILSVGGYSGHGVALAGLAGKVMAEAVAGQAERFDTLAKLPVAPLPLGPFGQGPLLALAMFTFDLRDRIGR